MKKKERLNQRRADALKSDIDKAVWDFTSNFTVTQLYRFTQFESSPRGIFTPRLRAFADIDCWDNMAVWARLITDQPQTFPVLAEHQQYIWSPLKYCIEQILSETQDVSQEALQSILGLYLEALSLLFPRTAPATGTFEPSQTFILLHLSALCEIVELLQISLGVFSCLEVPSPAPLIPPEDSIASKDLLSSIRTSRLSHTANERKMRYVRRDEKLSFVLAQMGLTRGRKTRLPTRDAERRRHERRRHGSSGDWILEHPSIKEWLAESRPGTSIVHLRGLPGSGKTVLAETLMSSIEGDSRSADDPATRPWALRVDVNHLTDGGDRRVEAMAEVWTGILAKLIQQDSNILDFVYGRLSNPPLKLYQPIPPSISTWRTLTSLAFKSHSGRILVVLEHSCSRARHLPFGDLLPAVKSSMNFSDSQVLVLITERYNNFHRRVKEGALHEPMGPWIDLDRVEQHRNDITQYLLSRLHTRSCKPAADAAAILGSSRAAGVFLCAVEYVQGTTKLLPNELVDRANKTVPGSFVREFGITRNGEDRKRDLIVALLLSAQRPIFLTELKCLLDISLEYHDLSDPRNNSLEDICGHLIMLEDGDSPNCRLGDRVVVFSHPLVKEALLEAFFQRSEALAILGQFCVEYLSTQPFQPSIGPSLGHAKNGYYGLVDVVSKFSSSDIAIMKDYVRTDPARFPGLGEEKLLVLLPDSVSRIQDEIRPAIEQLYKEDPSEAKRLYGWPCGICFNTHREKRTGSLHTLPSTAGRPQGSVRRAISVSPLTPPEEALGSYPCYLKAHQVNEYQTGSSSSSCVGSASTIFSVGTSIRATSENLTATTQTSLSVSSKANVPEGVPNTASKQATFYSYSEIPTDKADMQSVVSIDDDIDSTTSSSAASESKPGRAAVDYFVARLVEDPGLSNLYREALTKLEESRFIRNNRRLLKEYFINLQGQQHTASQKLAVNFLRSRSKRTQISAQIARLIAPLDESVRKTITLSLNQERDSLMMVNRLLNERDWVGEVTSSTQESGDGAFELAEAPLEGQVGEVDTQEPAESDCESDSSADSGEEVVAEATDALSKLKETAEFLIGGQAFTSYKRGLEDFLRPQPKEEPPTDDDAQVPSGPVPLIVGERRPEPTGEQGTESPANVPEETTSVADDASTDRTDIIERSDLPLTASPTPCLRQSPINMAMTRQLRFYTWVKQRTSKYFRPRLKEDYRRIEWTCDCGAPLYADFPYFAEDDEMLDALESSLKGAAPPPPSPPPPGSGPSSQSFSTASTMVSTASSTSMPATPGSPPSPGKRSGNTSNNQAQGPSTAAPARAANLPVATTQGRYKYLGLVVNTGGMYTTIAEIDASGVKSDAECFLMMKEAYIKTRGRRHKFRFLIEPTHVEFVQFTLWNLRHGYVSIFKRPNSIPPANAKEYEYRPRPLRNPPPMPPEVFIHYLSHGDGDLNPQRSDWLPRLPKRLDARVVDGKEADCGWGVYVVEGPNREIVFWALLLTVLAGLLTHVLWSVLREDVQGGAGLGALIVAVPSVVMGAFLFRLGRV